MQPYPRNFSHIGLSVPNIQEAIKFYTEVFGWYIIMEPSKVYNDDTPVGQMCRDVFGDNWEEIEIAHLSTGDRIGVELFAFGNNETPEDNFEFWKTGIFHFCIQDPNIEETVETIKSYGGKQRMPIREYYPGEKPYKMVYVEDPFGNVFEIYTHSYELTYSAGEY
ncbi:MULTISPECIES: lactoylglutathione lyase family protein [Pontibacillus]|uniref:Lactoylglutathione lyase family protein n=1 Tax=Pontibacillus chungwhensis TaxID=265426 RepID=A0ABY8UYU9_9BACI|nr:MULTISPECIES: lactoylglutathione lyase family protein [Pontibacillus]MCD5324889.1 lactoylglutathione lyase family protein [Pontibacillus sp. HN14]WIF98850.1 lactoylglutathione lyase family protein [Pontibacillus chungwhensis]